MRHFDHRMSAALQEERRAQARQLSRSAGEERHQHRLLRLKHHLGRRLIGLGRRMVADEIDITYRGREGVEPAPPN
jgi:hypothetical protein